MAWHTAAMSRPGNKLPEFGEFMRAGKPQTPEEQAEMWRRIGQTVGKVRKHNPKRVRIIRSNGGRNSRNPAHPADG